MVKPGSKDRKASILITGLELDELQRFVWMMAESFGLDRRIANYQGVRPIGLWRWDIECLVDVIDSVLNDPEYYLARAALNIRRSKRCATVCEQRMMFCMPNYGQAHGRDEYVKPSKSHL